MSLARLGLAVCAALAAVTPYTAFAHSETGAAGASFDPPAAVLLLLLGIVYARGEWLLARGAAPRDARRARAASFWLGWASLAVALGPPLETWTRSSFAAHMGQHELMMLVAAPLLVASRPFGVVIWGLPRPLANVLSRLAQAGKVRGAAVWLSSPAIAWLVHAAVLWCWHIPAAFEAALAHTSVHWIQHTAFFAAAVIFWWSVFGKGLLGERRGAAIVSVFSTAIHTSFLGVLLTFSAHPWYPAYAQAAQGLGLTPVEDQQLGGLIMWIPGGTVFLIVGIALTALWLKDSDRRATAHRWDTLPADVPQER